MLLTDGEDIDSQATIDNVVSTVGNVGEEDGAAIKLFAIAYGSDANKSILKQMAEPTGGKQYDSDPATINQTCADIATFF